MFLLKQKAKASQGQKRRKIYELLPEKKQAVDADMKEEKQPDAQDQQAKKKIQATYVGPV